MTAEDRFLDCLARMERDGKHRECCWVFPDVHDGVREAWAPKVEPQALPAPGKDSNGTK